VSGMRSQGRRTVHAFSAIAAGTIATLLLVASSGDHDKTSGVRLEYRFAPRDCTEGHDVEAMEYRLPGGRVVSAEVANTGGLALSVGEAEVSIHPLVSPYSGDADRVYAELVLEEKNNDEALAFRRDHFACQLAVFVEGTLVSLEPRFREWTNGVPGGIFLSLAAATAFYERYGLAVALVAPSPSEVARANSFWSWQRKHDLWRIKCDEQFKETMREEAPELFSELSKRTDLFEGISCDDEPIRPESEE
jgi:hypothetical protein